MTEAEADRRQEAERRANQAEYEARLREEQEKHEAQRRRAEEMARAKEEERKQALKSQLEQKLKEAARIETLKKGLAEKVKAAKDKAQQEQDAAARKKASEALLEKLAKERQAALLKTTPSGLSYFDRMQMEACDALRREVIAAGGGDPSRSPGKGTCGYNLGPVSPRLLPIPPPIPTEEISPLAAQQLGGLPAGLTAQELEHLRGNAVSLQPEQRKIAAAPAQEPYVPSHSSPSTFGGATKPSTPEKPPCAESTGIDKARASQVLPYALMSRAAYDDKAPGQPTPSLNRIADWQTILRDAGVSDLQITAIGWTGFSATIYRNELTGEVTIAYRGSENIFAKPNDWLSNYNARISAELQKFFPGYVDPQYQTAADLAKIVRSKYGNVSLTGHSLGGGLASYAGSQHGITSVYTFNAARNPFSTDGSNLQQVNVIVPGDNIGDPATGVNLAARAFGEGCLPGKTFASPTTGNVAGPIGGILGDTSHQMDGIIGGLQSTIAQR